ncbi:MAG: circularly permuted type 2 ATP-grasp protein [Solirubrobacteraceae bacterium]
MVGATDVHGCFEEPLPAAFADLDPAAAAAAVEDWVAHADVTFGDETKPFKLDPVPRVLSAAEWDPLAAGLGQRVRALDRFVADVYGRQRIVRDGVIPATAVATAEYFEPLMQQAVHEERRFITIAGLDCVRGPDGAFRVLEDNVRTPSGISYTTAARAAVTSHVPAPEGLQPLDGAFDALGAALLAAAPAGVDEPVVAILSDGPSNSAFWDHRTIAARLGVPLVRLADLRLKDGFLCARTDDGELRLDVVYRRTDEDRLGHPRGGLTPVAQLLLEPWSRGRLGLVNAFGTGVADDKLLHAHVEQMIRFYLDEEPMIESVRTYDLMEPGVLHRALDRLDELVIKPRAGHGGAGVVIGPRASEQERGAAADALRAAPAEYVIQEYSPLSVHPTVIDGRLEPRHVDLRPFVFYGVGEPYAMPGGLTRVALDEGEMIVNSSRNGGAKDTWVVA